MPNTTDVKADDSDEEKQEREELKSEDILSRIREYTEIYHIQQLFLKGKNNEYTDFT